MTKTWLAKIATLGLLMSSTVVAQAAAQERCGQDSAAQTTEYQLVSIILLRQASRLTDTVETVWLKHFDLPTDSSFPEARKRWVSSWYILVANCVSIPEDLRAAFALRLDTDNPPPDPYPEFDKHVSATILDHLDDHTITADVGGRYGGCIYVFELVGGKWRLGPPMSITTCSSS